MCAALSVFKLLAVLSPKYNFYFAFLRIFFSRVFESKVSIRSCLCGGRREAGEGPSVWVTDDHLAAFQSIHKAGKI